MSEIFEILKEIICEYVEVEPEDIKEGSSLRFDLGASSFDLMNIADAVEKKFKIKINNNSVTKIKTVGDIAKLLEEKINS